MVLAATLWLLGAGLVAAADLHGRVTWINDGDTLQVAGVGAVRLIGIDSPEMEDSPRDRYYQRQGIDRVVLRRVAREALRFNIRTVKGETVTLRTDAERRDRYGRLLAYVVLPDGHLLNRLLLEKGYAAVYRRFDFRLKKDFLRAEAEARHRHLGLWQK
jgi:micrococcal nuclease